MSHRSTAKGVEISCLFLGTYPLVRPILGVQRLNEVYLKLSVSSVSGGSKSGSFSRILILACACAAIVGHQHRTWQDSGIG